MKSLDEIRRRNKSPRVLGFDDCPFETRPRRVRGSAVQSVGIVTCGATFEGMLYVDGIEQDGFNGTEKLCQSIKSSKFHEQIHGVFLDGITMGGLNVIDVEEMANEIERPVISVMRTEPDISKMLEVVEKIDANKRDERDERRRRILNAGHVYNEQGWIFQFKVPASYTKMINVQDIVWLLNSCTPKGTTQSIPECLRIAHLIGAAIKTGQSSSSA